MQFQKIALYVIVAIVGYFAGCSHMSYYISRKKSIDIKGSGSKNYGASNTLLLAGIKAGILVFLHDVLKAAIPAICVRIILPNEPGMVALVGCSAVIGHIFPFYLKFDGGKGFAAFIGAIIALYPAFGAIMFILSVIVAIIGDKVVFSTFSFCIASIIYSYCVKDFSSAVIITATVTLIVWKHRENINNLIAKNGKEASIKASVFKRKTKIDEA